MSETPNLAYVILSLVPQVGKKTLENLLQKFGSPEKVFEQSIEDLKKVQGVGQKTAYRIASMDQVQIALQIQKWQKYGVRIITRNSLEYPSSLAGIEDAPLTLFVRGSLDLTTIPKSVAIVGTRNAKQKSLDIAHELGEFYAQAGYTIVSGLALGIDTKAHQGSLKSPKAPPIAVLGGGVLNIYPPQNKQLAEQIAQHGALISENAPDATAAASRLVIRNRIIAGLCQHVIVVESAINGGAMHAARAATKQGRTLYTLDLPVSGNQALIKQENVNIIDPDNPHLPLPNTSTE
ncbi:MAG: DNA-processing protein DprA [Chloroflexota bacterium]